MKPYPPLGTLVTAALARERGFEVALFDAMLAPGVEAFETALDDVEPAIVGILEDNFNFLTKMCTLRMRRAALDMIAAARGRGCRVVVNGSDAIDHPDIYLAAGAHAVIPGEVEETFLELARAWRADADAPLEGISGLALPGAVGATGGGLRARADVIRTAPRPRLDDLDALPFPAWDLVDVESYRRAWTEAHGRLSWNMVTSRGCPYACNWCAKPVFGRRYAQRSASHAAEELRLLRERVRPDHVWFADDIFGITPNWIEEFADEVTRRGARTPFTIQSRVNLMKPRAVAALHEAGCEEVWLGVESGSQSVLDAMDKGTRIEQVREATRTLQAQGIRACWFIQLGYLGETGEDLARTRDLILEERPDEIGVSVSYPLPGTPFHDTVRAQLAGKRNWEQTGDLDMLFHGTYTTAFYRRVRDLLHDEVDAYHRGEGPLQARWAELWSEEAVHRNPVAIAVGH
jgi:anaerobic magnesium-protoporphyrin IX monomethyl ester cyclase